MSLAAVAAQVFVNALVINRPALTTMFDSAFEAHDRRNRLHRDEVLQVDFSQPLVAEQKEWIEAVGEEMISDDTARKVYAGTVVTVLNGLLQSFSAGVQMGNGYRLDVGPEIRGYRVSRVLWAARNMVQHHDQWETHGEEPVRKSYPHEYAILAALSRGGGGVLGVDALDVLIRLTEGDERKYGVIERKAYGAALDIIKTKGM